MRSTRAVAPRGLSVVAVLLVAALGCGDAEVTVPEPPRPVKILVVGSGDARARREYPGTVAATQSAELSFPVSGTLQKIVVNEGDEVAAGAVLTRLDDRDFRSRLDKANANLNNARADWKRAQKLLAEGVLAEAAAESRQRAFEVAEAEAREAQKALEDTTLTAPFAGTVARKMVQDFENVQAKQPILVLQDASGLEIKVDVPERDMAARAQRRTLEETTARLQPRVTLTALPGVSFPARIKEFTSTADPATRTFRVTLAFVAPDDVRALPGMTAKVSIRAVDPDAPSGGLAVPASAAVADEAGGAFVWRVDPETMTVSRRRVVLGPLAGDQILVTSGLEDGDWIAISGLRHLRDGMTVSRLGS